MRPRCEDVRQLLAREAAGQLTTREFVGLDRHREVCPDCAALRSDDDALTLFAVLRERRPDPGIWSGLWDGVRAGIRTPRGLGGWDGRAFLRPAYRVAAAAALVLALGLLALGQLKEPVPPAVLELPTVPVNAAPTLATVESIGSPEARVYDMKVYGEDNQVTELVLIFDEEIEL